MSIFDFRVAFHVIFCTIYFSFLSFSFHHRLLIKFDLEELVRSTRYGFLDPGPIGALYEAALGWSTPSSELRGDAAAATQSEQAAKSVP